MGNWTIKPTIKNKKTRKINIGVENENDISQYEVVGAREPASFWLEKIVAVRCHSITGLSENVAVAEICYQRLKVLSFCDRLGD